LKLLLTATIALAALWNGAAGAEPLTREELTEQVKALQARVDALERERAEAGRPLSEPGVVTLPGTPRGAAPVAAATGPSASDEAELQALSRTLVQRGGLVLPPWRLEVVPSVAYSHRIVQGLALVQTPEGIPTVADQRLRQDQVRASAALRVGLPWSSQVEVRVPYGWLRQSRSLGDGTHAVNEGSGLGDIELSLSHQFLAESGWRPGLVGGLSWRAATGRDPFRIRIASLATGSGQDEVRARLTAIKSSDPVVFFGTLSYAHDWAKREAFGSVQPGDAYDLQLGAVLALSPETSMTFGLAQEFRNRSQFSHVGAPGTDTLASSLDLGLDRVITPNVLLDVSLGVGLTHDAPDYVFQVSVPIRLR
jgi:hypothetical protein